MYPLRLQIVSSQIFRIFFHAVHTLPNCPLQLTTTAFLFLSPPKHIRQSPTRNLYRTQRHRRTPDQPSRSPPLCKRVVPPPREHEVQSAQRRREPCCVGLKAVDVEVGGEEEGRREEQREWTERTEMLGCDEGGNDCGWC